MPAEIHRVLFCRNEGDGIFSLAHAQEITNVARMIAIVVAKGDLVFDVDTIAAQLIKETLRTGYSGKGDHRSAHRREVETARRLPEVFALKRKTVERSAIHGDHSVGPSQSRQLLTQASAGEE